MAKYDIYFGTYSKGPGNGVFKGGFDAATGEISLNGGTIDVENPSYLQLENNILYGVAEISGGALFSADAAKMQLLSTQDTHGRGPCHLWLKDGYAFTANYSEGSLSILRADKSGNIEPCRQSVHHFGRSVNKNRQNASHVHYVAVTPDSKYLALCDLGMDKVFLYPYCAAGGLSTNARIIDCPPGAGPRHLTFSRCGRYLYILTELANTVLAYKYDGLELMQEISTLPAGFAAQTTSAAIHVSPDGALLASSNRGHDSIAVFKIKAGGGLEFLTHVTGVKEPRDFRFSPDGGWLLAGQQNADCVTAFKINGAGFTETSSVAVPKPVCILFGGAHG